MKRQRTWLLALLASVAIEAFLSTMVHRAIVVPGGRTVWAKIGEVAHLPGAAVAEVSLDVKNPFGLFLEYASGFAVWFLASWAAIAILAALFARGSSTTTLKLIVVLTLLNLCSCSEKSDHLQTGNDPSWISHDVARGLCADFLNRQGYREAQVTGEAEMRGKCWYTFETNGVTAPVKVMVDRKSRKADYADWKR
jgi:hypothetical protein